MAGEKADMVFTDPPYNVPIKGHVSGLGAVKHREFAMASGEMDRAEFTAFLQRRSPSLAAASARRLASTSSAWTGATSASSWPPAMSVYAD